MFFGEVCADEFFVVSDVDVLVGEGGMRPADAAIKLAAGGLDEFCAADFVESPR